MPPEIMETSPFPGIPFFPGTFRRPPLAELGCGALSFADDTEG